MAWTDYSNTVPSAWDSNVGTVYTNVEINFDNFGDYGAISFGTSVLKHANTLSNFVTVPGFDDGYLPAGIPDPINNNIDQGGGGGSTRPSSGLLYPRGQG